MIHWKAIIHRLNLSSHVSKGSSVDDRYMTALTLSQKGNIPDSFEPNRSKVSYVTLNFISDR